MTDEDARVTLAAVRAENKRLRALIDSRHADAMIAHRWFEEHFGEEMKGRDFAVKCPMATQMLLERLDGADEETQT